MWTWGTPKTEGGCAYWMDNGFRTGATHDKKGNPRGKRGIDAPLDPPDPLERHDGKSSPTPRLPLTFWWSIQVARKAATPASILRPRKCFRCIWLHWSQFSGAWGTYYPRVCIRSNPRLTWTITSLTAQGQRSTPHRLEILLYQHVSTVHYLILYMVVLYKSRTAWDSVDPTVGQCKIR